MARKKEFDQEDAMGRATDLFRHKGFVASSIDDLVHATGLSRSSLYDTFGNKEQLFLAVLDRYRVEMMNRLAPDPQAPPAVALEGFLLSLLDAFEAWGPHAGCLITTTCSELTNTPDAVQASCTAALREQEDQLRAYFTDAADRGALPADTDVAHLAAYFVAMRQSIGLLWRAGEPRQKLVEIIKFSVQIVPAHGKRRAAHPSR
jgi:TetR/AcrR family transcriptional repressor of nem operon